MGNTDYMDSGSDSVFSKDTEIKRKLKLLDDFGIATSMIPNGYFANVRSQRDLDLRVKELIAKQLLLP